MKERLCAMLSIAVLALATQFASATTPITPSIPASVGYNKIAVPAQSDTLVGVAFTKPCVGEFPIGAVDTVNGTVTLDDSGTLSSEVFGTNSQGAALYYVRFVDGDLEGRWFNIASNSANELTLVEENTTQQADLTQASAGDVVAIIPHWTVDCLFPANLAKLTFSGSSSTSNRTFEILLPNDDATAGINPGTSTLFFLDLGPSFQGWLNLSGQPAGDTVVAPQESMILRNNNPVISGTDDPSTVVDESTNDLTLFTLGQCKPIKKVERIDVEAVQDDTWVSIDNAFPVALDDLGLISSGAFTPSTSTSNRVDELLVFDRDAVGFNKPTATFFFLDLGPSFQGWLNLSGQPVGTTEFDCGTAFVIRKAAGTPGTVEWAQP